MDKAPTTREWKSGAQRLRPPYVTARLQIWNDFTRGIAGNGHDLLLGEVCGREGWSA